MNIPQPVINTLKRVGIDYLKYVNDTNLIEVHNRFGYGSCFTTPLIAQLIEWVYATSNNYEMGIRDIAVSDFDRIRYFILKIDNHAYTTCID